MTEIRNCIVLGTGRSGTSLAAGMLSQAGYYMGGGLLPADEGNPRGYFESPEVNEVNELILELTVPRRRPHPILGSRRMIGYPYMMRWLAEVKVGTPMLCPPHIQERIAALVAYEPYCFKDPRFSYTLPAWRPFIGNAALICVFRDPASTAVSIVKRGKDRAYSEKIGLDIDKALRIWSLMYQHILKRHYREGGTWLFVHYHQLLDGSAISMLQETTSATVFAEIADRALERSSPAGIEISRQIRQTYEQLCALAGYEG